MANFFGGVIPTFPVSSNGAINSFTNGLIQNVGGTGINVALNQVVPEKWASKLGIGTASFENVLPTAQRSLMLNGQQLFSEVLTKNLTTSGPLSGLSNIAAGLAQNAFAGYAESLLNSITGVSTGVPPSQPGRWFPGAGFDPDANYGGKSYTVGYTGSDVVFSILPAVSAAYKESTMSLFEAKSPVALGLRERPPSIPQSLDVPLSVYTSNVESKINLAVDTGFNPGTDDFFNYISESELPINQAFTSEVNLRAAFLGNGWNFICAPDSISWSSEAQVERVPIFGSNLPPVISGSKSMRDLTMSDALVEGFSRGKTVEDTIARLEDLMNFTLDAANKYVKVPVYYVRANDKIYGNGFNGSDGGYFVIKSVGVKEFMRDLSGRTTRASVDVSFVQVPGYQVNKGRDIANTSILGRTSILGAVSESLKRGLEQANQQVNAAQAPSLPSNPPVSPTNKPIPAPITREFAPNGAGR